MHFLNITNKQTRLGLFTLLIILAPISKYPYLGLPLYNFSSFRIGQYQLLALLFVVSCVFGMAKNRQLKANKAVLVAVLGLVTSLGLGLIWAINKPRSLLLVASIILLVLLLVSAYWYVACELTKTSVGNIGKYLLVSGIVFGLLAIGQFLLSTFTKETLGILCLNCSGTVFGFPRVNLFTAEPQFLANSLIPVFFVAVYAFYRTKTKLTYSALAITSIAISITFSRGAFFAIALGCIVLATTLLATKKNSGRAILGAFFVVACSFLIGFAALVGSASYAHKNSPNIAYETVRTMVEQISLGKVTLPQKKAVVRAPAASETPVSTPTAVAPTTVAPATTTPIATPTPLPASTDNFVSPGLIVASTNERLSAAQLALKAWSNGNKNILLGVGAGNLGPYVVANIDSTAPNNLTVYIFYILILAELGLVGLACFVFLLVFSAIKLAQLAKQTKLVKLAFLLAIIVAFTAQYFFFGSYINAAYIWLWLGISLGVGSLNKSKLSKLLG